MTTENPHVNSHVPAPDLDYNRLNAVRRELDTAADALMREGREHPGEAAEAGYCTKALEDAEEAVFGVMNCLNAYLGVREAKEAIDNYNRDTIA